MPPVLTPRRCAVATLRMAALSQVSLVMGLGSSWSQPLLAKRPSYMVGSGRKSASSLPPRCGAATRARMFSAVQRGRLWGQRGAGHQAIVHRAAPPRFEIGARMRPGPVCAQDIAAVQFLLAGEHLQDLEGRAAVVQGLDEGLLQGDGSIEGARVAPRLQVVRLRQTPLAELRGFVVVEAEVDAQARLADAVAHAQIDRRVEHRIAADDQEQVHRAGVQIFHQVLQGRQLVGRVGLDGIGVEDGLAHVAQGDVHGVGQGMHDRRLVFAGESPRSRPCWTAGRARWDRSIYKCRRFRPDAVHGRFPRRWRALPRRPRYRRRAAASGGRLWRRWAWARAPPRKGGSWRSGRRARGGLRRTAGRSAGWRVPRPENPNRATR